VKINAKLIAAAAAATLGMAAMGGAAQAANLIVNGDFSSPDVGGGWGLFASIPGWTSQTADTIEVGASGIYGLPCATADCQNLEVNANTFGSVAQTVSGLMVGAKYDLSWLYGGRTSGGPDILDVYFGGVLVATNTGGAGVWTLNNVSVTATATSEDLVFTARDTSGLGGLPSYGNEITGVSLAGAVPEPASWAMMLLGVGGLGAVLRHQRQQGLATA
jgi:hypothetical protein